MLSTIAYATPTRTPVAVHVEDGTHCAAEPAFVEALRRQGALVVDALAGDRGATVHVIVRGSGARGIHGQLEVRRGDARSDTREVDAISCAEVVEALALVAAVALDELDPQPVVIAPPPPSPTSPVKAISPTPRAQPPRAQGAPFVLGVGLTGGIAFIGASPGPTMGAYFDAEGTDAAGPLLAGRSLRVGLHSMTSAVHASPVDGTTPAADLLWWFPRGTFCPIRSALSGSVAVRVCADAEAGFLWARGRGYQAPANRTRPWLAVGAGGALSFRPVPPLVIEVVPTLSVPVVRDRWVVDPGVSLYRAPPVIGTVNLGFGVTLP